MEKTEWILCPVCGSKTRDKIRENTILRTISFTAQSAGRKV